MRVKKFRHFVGDFETTVYAGQTSTEVWASAVVELFTEDVKILHSIEETFDYLAGMKENVMIYYVGTSRARFRLEIVTTITDKGCLELLNNRLKPGSTVKLPKKEFSTALNAMGVLHK